MTPTPASSREEQKRWINRYRRLTGDPSQHGPVISEFECRCDPATSAHERMMRGALRNMRDDAYLEDGISLADEALRAVDGTKS